MAKGRLTIATMSDAVTAALGAVPTIAMGITMAHARSRGRRVANIETNIAATIASQCRLTLRDKTFQ
jgi:hypothetical protein